MVNNTVVRFVKDNGSEFVIQRDTDWRFLKNGLINIGTADGQLTYADNVMGDGGKIQNVRLTRVDRTIQAAYLKRDNNGTARQEFAKFFVPKTTYKIYVSYMGVTRWAEGTLYRMQLSENLDDEDLLTATVTFAFANPFWKSVDNFGHNIAEVVPMKAFPYLCKVGSEVPTGAFLFDRQVHLHNEGDINIYPDIIIRASDSCTNPIFYINDAFIKINDIMSSGDEITLNLGAMPPRIEKNGQNYFGHVDKSSQLTLCYLKQGDNIVSFNADDGASSLAVTVYYNKMYMVI